MSQKHISLSAYQWEVDQVQSIRRMITFRISLLITWCSAILIIYLLVRWYSDTHFLLKKELMRKHVDGLMGKKQAWRLTRREFLCGFGVGEMDVVRRSYWFWGDLEWFRSKGWYSGMISFSLDLMPEASCSEAKWTSSSMLRFTLWSKHCNL